MKLKDIFSFMDHNHKYHSTLFCYDQIQIANINIGFNEVKCVNGVKL